MEKIEKLKSFLVHSPGDAFLKHALALEYIKIGNEKGAKHLFIEILEQDPFYTGSYYHLARLLERTGERADAKSWYEKGLIATKQAGDMHAYNELQAAYEDFIE